MSIYRKYVPKYKDDKDINEGNINIEHRLFVTEEELYLKLKFYLWWEYRWND